MPKMQHIPVLYKEVIRCLKPYASGKYIDGTVGSGGHAKGILQASGPNGMLLGLDIDTHAVKVASSTLKTFGERAIIKKSSYVEMDKCVSNLGWHKVDGIILDLGLSSEQLDQSQRGFSFNLEGPLDMRFDTTEELMADEIVNNWPEHQIGKILYELGEETQSNRIARALVNERPIESTVQLAQIVANCKRRSKVGRHVATKTFQALRIAVNKEIDNIINVLPKALEILAPGGRLVIIAFHSLEDRLVKRFFRQESQDCLCPAEQITCVCGHHAIITRVNRRPIRPTNREITINRRSRSARLRIAEKI